MLTELARRRTAGTFGRIDRTVDNHRTRKTLAIESTREDSDKATKRMANDDRRLFIIEETSILADSHLLFGENFDRIAVTPAAVAHARDIDRSDAIFMGKKRRDERPPARMRAIAMNQQQAGFRDIAPTQIFDPRAFYFDGTHFRLDRNGAREPSRRFGDERSLFVARRDKRMVRLTHALPPSRGGRSPKALKTALPVRMVRSPHQMRPCTV